MSFTFRYLEQNKRRKFTCAYITGDKKRKLTHKVCIDSRVKRNSVTETDIVNPNKLQRRRKILKQYYKNEMEDLFFVSVAVQWDM